MNKSRSSSLQPYKSLIISSKLNQYRQKFNQSQQKFNEKYTRDISSPKKSISLKKIQTTNGSKNSRPSSVLLGRSPSATKKQILNVMIDSSEQNPQRRFTLIDLKGSLLLSELDNKAKQMSEYAQQNASLLARKNNLQGKILSLKRAIAEQNKRLNQTQINCGVLTNNIELTEQRYRQKNLLAIELNKRIQDTKNDNKDLRKKVNQGQAESNYNKEHIQLLNRQIQELSISVCNTNVSIIKENRDRLIIKQNLCIELKVMQNDAILYRELVSQRDNLGNDIDKAFLDNKLDGSIVSGRSRLSVISKK